VLDTHALDMITGRWRAIGTTSLAAGRVHAAYAYLNGKLILHGGRDLRTMRSVIVFDCNHEQWTEQLVSGTPTTPSIGASAVVINEKIVLFGGESQTGVCNSVTIICMEQESSISSPPKQQQQKSVSSPVTISHDVMLVVQGQTIPVHSGVLAKASSAVDQLLQRTRNTRHSVSGNMVADMKPNGVIQITFTDQHVSAVGVHALISCLYNGTVPAHSYEAMLRAAAMLRCATVASLAETQLAKDVRLDNACRLLVIAHECNAPQLKGACAAIIQRHMTYIRRTAEWDAVPQELRRAVSILTHH